ncbi:hypothetical protein FQZ97_984930 [compost metagenome]
MLGQDGHAAIFGNAHEGVGHEGAGRGGQGFAAAQQRREGDAQREAAAALEESAPADIEDAAGGPGFGFVGTHGESPQARLSAVSWIAARIRT